MQTPLVTCIWNSKILIIPTIFYIEFGRYFQIFWSIIERIHRNSSFHLLPGMLNVMKPLQCAWGGYIEEIHNKGNIKATFWSIIQRAIWKIIDTFNMSLNGEFNCSKPPSHNIIFDFLPFSLCKKVFVNSNEINFRQTVVVSEALLRLLYRQFGLEWWGRNISTILLYAICQRKHVSTINIYYINNNLTIYFFHM